MAADPPPKIDNFFSELGDLYRALKPLRLALIVTVLGVLVFWKVEQGREILRALAEPGTRTGATGAGRLSWFAMAVFLWSFVSWYSARVLLDVDLARNRATSAPTTGRWPRVRHALRAHLPRIFGVAPLLAVGASFLSARGSYETHLPPPRLFYFGWAALLCAGLLYLFFILRRKWVRKRVREAARQDVDLGRRVTIATMLLATLGLTILFVIDPVRYAGAIGTGAVLGFAFASWIFWGSWLIFFGSRHHVPVLLLLLTLAIVFSFWNDNHDVRVVRREPFSRPVLRQALREWSVQIENKYPGRASHPLFIVASEGGGIRAAYWTATVLGTLQDRDPAFADHIFAISGVSGGSLGAAVFDALVADAAPPGEFAKRGEAILGQDFLSPAIAGMLYPDFVQRLLPFPVLFFDRGRALEHGWEQAWRNTMGNDRFAQPFLDLWQDRQRYVPALFLNGTSVETGNRIIASNILIDAGFLEAADATAKLFPPNRHHERRQPTLDMPLSTAAHMSARFTYVSPAGRFNPDGSHVVDGGYFENSGAATALDILRSVHDALREDDQLRKIVPHIVMISNDPLGVASGSRTFAATKQSLRQLPRTAADEAKRRKPATFLGDALAPVWALMSTREARGDYAQRAIGDAEKQICRETANAKCLHFFSLAPATVPLPLGWMLSNRAAEAMQEEMFDKGISPKAPVPTWNQDATNEIIATLNGTTP